MVTDVSSATTPSGVCDSAWKSDSAVAAASSESLGARPAPSARDIVDDNDNDDDDDDDDDGRGGVVAMAVGRAVEAARGRGGGAARASIRG
jgi:hypothetical protein